LAGSAELSALLISFSSTIPELRDDAELLPAAASAGGDANPAQTAAKIGIFSAAGRRLFGGRSTDEQAAAPPPVTNAPPPPVAQDFADEPEEILEDDTADAEDGGRSSGGRFWLVLALIVIPLLIIGLVAVMVFGRARASQQEFQQLLVGATQAVVDAEGLTDEAAIAQRLSGASDFLEKARARRPDDAELAKLDARYQALLDKVEHVTPLYGAVPLWTFEGEGHNITRVVVSGDSLFTLDRGPGQVDRFIRSQLGDSVTPSENPVVVKKGQEISGTVVSDLQDMTWAEAAGPNQRSKLLVLDTAKGLVGYDTQLGTKRLALGGADKLVKPQLTAGYGGNLYIVDGEGDQVWRYRPDASGYGGQPEASGGCHRRQHLAVVRRWTAAEILRRRATSIRPPGCARPAGDPYRPGRAAGRRSALCPGRRQWTYRRNHQRRAVLTPIPCARRRFPAPGDGHAPG
jgi:hypothetical protein